MRLIFRMRVRAVRRSGRVAPLKDAVAFALETLSQIRRVGSYGFAPAFNSDTHWLARRRFVFARGVAEAAGLCVADEGCVAENHPRHQPTPAPTTSTKMIAITRASLSAMRRILLARNKNIPPKISRIRSAPTLVIRCASKLPTAYCLLPTAYCLLPTAYCLLPTTDRCSLFL